MAYDDKIDEIANYLRRAALAREEGRKSPSPTLKDGFLKLADEWEHLARTAAAINAVQTEAASRVSPSSRLP